MKKKQIACLLIVILCITGAAGVRKADASISADSYKAETMILTGIMEDYSLSQLSSTKKVTRAQFAKMLVNASGYKNQTESTLSTSLYKDVSYKNKYAGYIKTAVEQGFMNAAINGQFKPNDYVTLKDAAKAITTMLGYTKSDFSGNLINAQIAKFNALGFNDNVKKTKNNTLTLANCKQIFYKLLNTKTREGTVYASVLGYPTDSDGKINYLSLLQDSLKGPVLLTGALSSTVPFKTSKAVVYRNESLSIADAIAAYDVLYYSEELKTIWAYHDQITGTLEAVSPNRSTPESITVSGTVYTLGTQEMVYAFSNLGNFSLNENLTIFLGMDGNVAAARNTADYNTEVNGVVLEYGTAASTNSSDPNVINDYFTMVDAGGNKTTHYYDNTKLTLSKLDAVKVEYSADSESVQKVTDTGKLDDTVIDAAGLKIGSYALDTDVQILDICEDTQVCLPLKTEHADKIRLYSGNVLYYDINSAGKITSLILKNTAGTSYGYGVITEITTKNNADVYNCQIDGQEKSINADITEGDIILGTASRFEYIDENDDDATDSVKVTTLTSVNVTQANSSYIKTNDTKIPVFSNAAVYYSDKEGNYYATTLAKVNDLKKYTLTAYYDPDALTTNSIRVIIAKNK